jgi:hypothetical protein
VASMKRNESSTPYPWLASNLRAILPPTASRTASTRAISSSTSIPPFSFSARNPCVTKSRARRTVSASSRMPTVTLVAMRSRKPPSSW